MSPIIGSKNGLSASAYGFTANAKPIVTGGTLYSDSTYFYRAFTGSGTLSVASLNLTADVLVIAGGGGGYISGLSAGGAGGYRYFSNLTLTPTSYTCTVGSGGSGETSYGVSNNTKGNNSSFIGGVISYSSTGGGSPGISSGAGGSGSGGNGTGNQGGYTPPEGYNGVSFASGGAGGPATNTGLYGTAGPGSSAQSSWGAATGLGENVSGTYYFAGGGGNGRDTYQGIAQGASGPGQFGSGGGGLAGGRNSTVNSWFAAGNGQNGAIIIRYLKSAV